MFIITRAQSLGTHTIAPTRPVEITVSPTPSGEEKIHMLETQVNELHKETFITRVKDSANILQSIFTVIALIISGTWGYWLFVQNRQRYPRATIEHQITHRPISDDKLLLHVVLNVHNIGNILLSIISIKTRVHQVFPPSTEILEKIKKGESPLIEGYSEIGWHLLDKQEFNFEKGIYEIEPGEKHEFNHDFILDADIETLEVYSYIKNEKKLDREIGWDSTIMYDLTSNQKDSSRNN